MTIQINADKLLTQCSLSLIDYNMTTTKCILPRYITHRKGGAESYSRGGVYNPTAVIAAITAHRGAGRESAVASARNGEWCGGRSPWPEVQPGAGRCR